MPDLFLCSGVFEVKVLLSMCLENRTVLMCRYMLYKRDTLVSTDTYFIPVSQFLRLRSLWLAADQERLLNESPLRGHFLVLRGEHRAGPQGKVFVLGFELIFAMVTLPRLHSSSALDLGSSCRDSLLLLDYRKSKSSLTCRLEALVLSNRMQEVNSQSSPTVFCAPGSSDMVPEG